MRFNSFAMLGLGKVVVAAGLAAVVTVQITDTSQSANQMPSGDEEPIIDEDLFVPSPVETPEPIPSIVPTPEATPGGKRCCAFVYLDREDTFCEALDEAQCLFPPETDQIESWICVLRENEENPECINAFQNSCERKRDRNCNCDVSIMHPVFGMDLTHVGDQIDWPNDCTSREIEYCGHGIIEMCSGYFELAADSIPENAGEGFCLSLSSDACSIAQDQAQVLAHAEELVELIAESHPGVTCTITANQIISIYNFDICEDEPASNTPMTVCCTADNTTASYPPCRDEFASCQLPQVGQSYTCDTGRVDDDENAITRRQSCCYTFGVIPADDGTDDGFEIIITGTEIINADQCPDLPAGG